MRADPRGVISISARMISIPGNGIVVEDISTLLSSLVAQVV